MSNPAYIRNPLEGLAPTIRPVTVPRDQVKRKEALAFYNSSRWRKLRIRILRAHPTCLQCKRDGKVTLATEVHHVLPRLQNAELAYTPSNLEPLCSDCHKRKPKDQR